MQEIDNFRGEIMKLWERIHAHTTVYHSSGCSAWDRCSICNSVREQIECARACIETRLREWWEQGCKEVTTPDGDGDEEEGYYLSLITRAEFGEWQEEVKAAFRRVGVRGLRG